MFSTVSFLQASFYSTPVLSRCLIHPLDPQITSPDHRSWKSVNDEIFARVGSRSLLDLVSRELVRDLRERSLEHINGWVFHSSKALAIKDKLESAAKRYVGIRDGVFAQELRAALVDLFDKDPRFQARLSLCDDLDDALDDVCSRVLSQCRFNWEMGLFSLNDTRSFGLRLMVVMHDMIYEQTVIKPMEDNMLTSRHFHYYDAFEDKMSQFRGIDTRFDKALADYKHALSCLPDDGSSLYGGGLKDFWRELTILGNYLNTELENVFHQQPGISDDFDEGTLIQQIDSQDIIDDLIILDQCDIDTGVDLGWNDSITGVPNVNNDFDLSLAGMSEDFCLTPSPAVPD